MLWRMAAGGPLELPDAGAIREIASLAAGNVRQLEGAMTRVIALASVLGEPVTAELVHKALGTARVGEQSRPPAGGSPSIEAVQEAACAVFEVSRSDLLSAKRTTRIAHARQLAIYLTRDLTSLSLAEIARGFNRDHSTVLHAIRAVSSRLEPGSETTTLLDRSRALVHDASPSPPGTDHGSHEADESPRSPSTTTTLHSLS